MSMTSSTAVFLISLLGIPITYIVNQVSTLNEPILMFATGVAALLLVAGLTYMSVGRREHSDPLFYIFALTTFASVVDLIISLENDGIIEGFMTNYLKMGEPYLKTSHGTMICYWDGIGHYAMYLMMLSALAWNQSYREVGLYWVGSIGHSMVVFMPGNVIGKYGVKWSYLLNVPYVIIPVYCAVRFLRQKPTEPAVETQEKNPYKSIFRRPADIGFLLYFLAATFVACLRGFAVMGCVNCETMKMYAEEYEPYLQDAGAYGKVQMLVYLFYFVPYYIASAYALLSSKESWVPDWALIHAGAASQAQVTHIGASLHYRTPYIQRVPAEPHIRAVFWTINLALLVVPQLFAYRTVSYPAFFQKSTSYKTKKQ